MKKLSPEKEVIIEKMIPFAVRKADAALKKVECTRDEFVVNWNNIYHKEMDRLCKKEGVRV